MVKRSIGGVERDYLLVAYRGGDKLYIPSDQIDSIRQYVGGEAPKLHKLGGSALREHQKPSQVRGSPSRPGTRVALPTTRHRRGPPVRTGHPRGRRKWKTHFRSLRLPTSTRPSLRSSPTWNASSPMDRLVCGDVGFGKTEIAIRAAFKAIQDGKQVAVLTPTTLLANAARKYVSPTDSPAIQSGLKCCRGSSPQHKPSRSIAGVKSGEIDCVIGTHRLLAADINFKDIGLLVVDEEQRFGVQHKEKMKRIKTNVDVLTLSATPIPRTLEMSLVGIRDLSLLQTPPGRTPTDPDLCRGVRRASCGRSNPSRTPPRRAGLLGPQPRPLDRHQRPAAAPTRPRGTHCDRPRTDGRGLA